MIFNNRLIFIIPFVFFLTAKGISQETQLSQAPEIKAKEPMAYTQDYKDSLWCFYPFAINIAPGIWVPSGKLSNYYNPCFQLGLGFGIMLSSTVNLELGIVPRFLINKKKIEVTVNDTLRKTNTPSSASIGGGINITFFRNKIFCMELIPGLSWEPLTTEIRKPGAKEEDDSKYNLSAVGYSLGLNTWINKFGRQNFGIKFSYGYAAYSMDSSLNSNIGGSFISFSFCYRYPGRDISNLRFYHH